LASLQREILTSAAALLSPGGLLVYATCSIEPEENEQQIRSFLEQQPEFGLEPPRTINEKFLDAAGQLRVLPHEHGFDGAFAARLRKRA
jgi:16S rRNA (cytosine967-C5)-methyltransferase